MTATATARIFELFAKAKAAGLKYPKIRLETETGTRVVLHQAGSGSRYVGQVQITDGGRYPDNRYFGRIDLSGALHAGRDMSIDVQTLLTNLGEHPEAVASAYGHLTGSCCFCGILLRDSRSLAKGYGPVCAEKFGLDWGGAKSSTLVEVHA
jgi:hypothetical protein